VSASASVYTLQSEDDLYLELWVYPERRITTPVWWSASSLSAATAQSLATWTATPQHSEGKEEGKRVSDRSSRKNGLWAASWQRRGQCCFASSYGKQRQGDPRNIYESSSTRTKTTSTSLPHDTASYLVSTFELTSLFALNSCWRTV